MRTNKRKFERFDLPLIVKFRPIYGATDFSLGLTKNFSFEGLSLEAHDFNFIQNENLELNLKFPQSTSNVSLFGDVVWKRRAGDKSLAGVKFRMDDSTQQDELFKKISAYTDIPVDRMSSKDVDDFEYEEKIEKSAAKKEKKKEARAKKEHKKKSLKKPVPESEPAPGLGFIKQYHKGGSRCKVTFRLPREAAPDAARVTIVGDFNSWDVSRTPMSRAKNGDYTATIDLSSKKEYKFRYCIDGERWENDWQADKYLPNEFGTDDSVLIV